MVILLIILIDLPPSYHFFTQKYRQDFEISDYMDFSLLFYLISDVHHLHIGARNGLGALS